MGTDRLSWLVVSLFGLSLALFTFGCAGKPCQTSSQCGASEVCASERCQALSCSSDATWFAIDPSTGQCRPLPACGNRDDVRGWKSCTDPCQSEKENSCIADPRCQPVFSSTETGAQLPCAEAGAGANGTPPSGGDFGGCGNGGDRTFVGCRANPLPVDPCQGLSQTDCQNDPRCVAESVSPPVCNCPANSACTCPDTGSGGVECRVKTCSDYTSASDCTSHPECELLGSAEGDPPGAPTPQPAPLGTASTPDQPITCVSRSGGSCDGMNESTCLTHPECHPVGSSCYCPANTSCGCTGGHFSFCEPDDGLARCDGDADCAGNQRCSNDDPSDLECAPPVGSGGNIGFASGSTGQTSSGSSSSGIEPLSDPAGTPPSTTTCAGVCVPKGCQGYGENRCNADPTCQPIYTLECSPYGNASGGALTGCGGVVPENGGAIPPEPGCGACQPTFTGCADSAVIGPCDSGKSVLLRDPTVVDDPTYSFASVMTRLSGQSDPGAFVTAWLGQIGTDVTVSGRTVPARTAAGVFLAQLPHRADGTFDVAQLGFQPTALANRIDLAGPNDCGEARITYALASGATDRQDRMTVIVELKQPDDGAQCATTARKWLALSSLSGSALADGARAIYLPLLAPAHLGQVRTNEFLVGAATDPAQATAWQLREWHLGADGLLHLATLAQAVDPQLAQTDAFATWATANASAILRGGATVPSSFLALSATEDGSRIQLAADPTGQISTALNQQGCAGCHTTETNTAFAQVAERFAGSGRAEISEFLRNELPRRSNHLLVVAAGRLDAVARNAPKPVH